MDSPNEVFSGAQATSKKPRPEETRNGRPRICRDDEFWEDDGMVVLVARNVGFRIHNSVLAHHSPVFADMLSIPAGSMEREKYDGVSLVHLHDDAEDVEELFKVFYTLGCAPLPD